jgi:uncharacterized protein (TIGR02996 family)
VSEGDPFLTALAGRPHDDTLRLVYADWLDEHGRPDHAVFLRLEVRLRHAEPGPGWFALGRAFLRAAHATPDDWRELVSRPRLAGTTWRQVDSDGEVAEEAEFHPGGTLTHRDGFDDGVPHDVSPGTWRQLGPRVVLTINGYSVFRGTVRGDVLRMRGRRIAPGDPRLYWHLDLSRAPGPDCIPDLS